MKRITYTNLLNRTLEIYMKGDYLEAYNFITENYKGLDTPMYVALILLSQHWLTAIIGIPGIACVYLISGQEDLRLIEKFGDDYKHYMQKVPRMNLLAGSYDRYDEEIEVGYSEIFTSLKNVKL